MDFSDTAEMAAFRQGLRSWLGSNVITQHEDEPHARFLQRWRASLCFCSLQEQLLACPR